MRRLWKIRLRSLAAGAVVAVGLVVPIASALGGSYSPTLTPDVATIPNDNTTATKLTLDLTGIAPGHHVVVFKTNLGQLDNSDSQAVSALDWGTYRYWAYLTSSTAGVATVRAIVDGTQVAQTTVTVVAPDPSTSTVTSTASTVVSNCVDPFQIQIQLRTSDGSIWHGASYGPADVEVHAPDSVYGGGIATNNGNGSFSSVLTSCGYVGTSPITVSVYGQQLAQSPTVTFTPAPVTSP
jgi:hypothetical protein